MAPPVILSRDPGPIRKNWDWEKYPCPPCWLDKVPLPPKNSIAGDMKIKAIKRSFKLKYKNIDVTWGIKIDPEKLIDQPDIFWIANEKDWYTILMVDLDVPSRDKPKCREVLLWLCVNIPEERIWKGTVLAEYLPPDPQEETGEHRIVAFVYRQLTKIKFREDFISAFDVEPRHKFSSKKFARKYLLGEPIFGTYFFTEFTPPPPPPPPPKTEG